MQLLTLHWGFIGKFLGENEKFKTNLKLKIINSKPTIEQGEVLWV